MIGSTGFAGFASASWGWELSPLSPPFRPLAFPPPSPFPPPQYAALEKDPHIHFAHGGRADFRGRDGVYYNFFSAPGLAVNLRTENATFPADDNVSTGTALGYGPWEEHLSKKRPMQD